jgi:NAD(P)-dependent dehydrogenase (short-subunit alcohol dehydrogenase family)
MGDAGRMKDFRDKLAVVTGGGTGMGRALAEQLTAAGCHVAICDVSAENMAETQRLCEAGASSGVRVSTHLCDVADERQVLAFRDAVTRQHATDHIELLFNNAGIGGGGSFVKDDRAEWDRTFGVCWFGVYYCTRAFLPLLIASKHAHIVNTSSVNGFWASLGPGIPHTAYSTAKFAVKGFSEALIGDLRLHAPHVKVAVVMPGHIGTSIVINTAKVLGKADALHMSSDDVAAARTLFGQRGIPVDTMSDDDVRAAMHQLALSFRDNAPVSAAQAATIILDGVRTDSWRILVGDDAHALDRMVRESPDSAYEESFVDALHAQGFLQLFE